MKTTHVVSSIRVWESFVFFMFAIGSLIKTDAHAQSILVKDHTSQAIQLDVMDSIKKEVDDLDAKEQYKYAYKIIRDKLIEKPLSIDCMKYAIDHAEKQLSSLVSFNTLTAKSVFNSPEENYKTLLKGLFKLDGAFAVIGSSTSFTLPAGYLAKDAYDDIRELDEKNIQFADLQEFDLIDKKDALKVVNQYDLLKENVKFYLEVLENSYSVNESKETKEAILDLKNQAEKLKESILKSRCVYVSYVIVSPNLAEASKQIYIATSVWTRLDDQDKLKEVAVKLANAFNNEWVETSEQDVRFQLFDVITELKKHVGNAKWAELETLTSLLDSNDPSKQRGSKAWWNE